MWNEPDLSWTPSENANDYAILAMATGKAIKGATPSEVCVKSKK